MMSSSYCIMWHCDHDCDLCDLYDSSYILSYHLVPSKFKIRDEGKKKKEVGNIQVKIKKTFK